ncbi:MAG TPA: diacylglycerol kinase family protein [Ktedonobacterales bacterium]|nr:diacylglycerol kinase family protein [Ktedonobacterales bacterium]
METKAQHVEEQTDSAQVVVMVNANARMGADDCLSPERLGASLKARGLRGRVQPTESEEDCYEQVARAAREGAEVIVSAGGDGTVRSVIEGLVRVRGQRPALGILACGTMNNIAASFGIPEDIEEGLDLVAECLQRERYFPMDIGMIGDQPFVEVAGVGLMARLFPLAENIKSRGLQAGGDIIEGMREIVEAQPEAVTLWLDGRRVLVRALQVTLCNTPSHGARIVLSPDARVDDGLLDVVVDDRVSGPRMLWDMVTRMDTRLMTRQRRRIFQARRIAIEQAATWALQMDGVYKGEYGPGAERAKVEARVEPSALRVCAAERPPAGGAAEPESVLKTLTRLLPAASTTAVATAATSTDDAELSDDADHPANRRDKQHDDHDDTHDDASAGSGPTTKAAVQEIASGVASGAEGIAQTVTQGAQTFAQDVNRQVERRLASPEHAAQRLKKLRWVYTPGITLGVVAALAARQRAVLPGDREILTAIQRTQSPLMDRAMSAVAAPGFPPLSVELIGAGAVALWLMRLRLESAFLLAAAGGVTLLDTALKGAVQRKRPEDGVARVLRLIQAPSFPSGHTMNYVSVFGFLGAASMANVKPSPLRSLLVGSCLTMIGLIGPARVYLGAHWPSDTAAGYLFGSLYLGGLLELYTFAKQRQADLRRGARR